MVFYAYSPEMELHEQPWNSYHIETPKRLLAIKNQLKDSGLENRLTNIINSPPRLATMEELTKVHTERYINDIASTASFTSKEEMERFSSKYEDIYVNEHTYQAALIAAAASIDLVQAVLEKKQNGFAAVRPPGHHASPDYGCGFCIFNNVAMAAKNARRFGAQKIVIVDWDVHAGQGTQECIADDENIWLISSHRYEEGRFWPNLEQSAVRTQYKNTINVPLNKTGMGDVDFLSIMKLVVLPVIHDFKPDLILVSCGFDAALGDPEGEMRITPAGYATMTRMLTSTGIPVAMILEGGYFLEAVAASTEHIILALLGDPIPALSPSTTHKELSPVFHRIHAHFKNDFPTFNTFHRIGKALKSHDYDEEKIEYKGERTVSAPYDTRGLYNERPKTVVDTFKTELNDLLDNSEPAKYTDVEFLAHYHPNEFSIVTKKDEKTISFIAPISLIPAVAFTMGFNANPLATFTLPENTVSPSDEEIKILADFLSKEMDNTNDFC